MAQKTSTFDPIPVQVETLQKQIQVCKKFINSSAITSLTIVFNGKHNGFEYTDILKMDTPDFSIVPVKDLFDFFQHLADNLYAKKLKLEHQL